MKIPRWIDPKITIGSLLTAASLLIGAGTYWRATVVRGVEIANNQLAHEKRIGDIEEMQIKQNERLERIGTNQEKIAVLLDRIIVEFDQERNRQRPPPFRGPPPP